MTVAADQGVVGVGVVVLAVVPPFFFFGPLFVRILAGVCSLAELAVALSFALELVVMMYMGVSFARTLRGPLA
eukprot:8395526-Heterocapsa_arctica.AAC.1